MVVLVLGYALDNPRLTSSLCRQILILQRNTAVKYKSINRFLKKEDRY